MGPGLCRILVVWTSENSILPRTPVNSAGRSTGARRSGPMVAALYNVATFLPPSPTHLFSTTENPFLHPPRSGGQGWQAQGCKCEAGGRSKETSAPNGIGTQGLHISDLSVYTGRATELSAEVSLRGSEWTSKASPTVGGSLQ
jgi:hypothetical protein